MRSAEEPTKKQKGRQILLDSGTVLRPKVGTAYQCGFES
jgi:hypothetical protein